MAQALEGIGMRRAVILLAATAAALFLASILAPKEPSAQTTSAVNGKIVYVKRDTAPGEHLNDIWVMDADGTNQTNLTNTPDVGESQPTWEPSGAQLAFVRYHSSCDMVAEAASRTRASQSALEALRSFVRCRPCPTDQELVAEPEQAGHRVSRHVK
jgi:dipeptidyl aminopeptidase/acylaminoacyl peptidase